MGRMIEKIILSRGMEYAGWTEAVTETDPALAKECVCIDFTTPDAFRTNYRFLAENFKAVVVGTTGWADIRDEVVAYFEKCGTPMIWATNFSVGVNVFFAVTDYVSKLLGQFGGYSPYMVEMHHCHKLDAPSGTAISLANDILDRVERKDKWVNEPTTDANAIEITSLREGTVPGTHTVTYTSADDTIELKHTLFSRRALALGAVVAAEFVATRKGVFTIDDLFN